MGKNFFYVIALILFSALILSLFRSFSGREKISGAPPYGASENEAPSFGKLSWLSSWKRPGGPPKVALQVGHWKNDDLPDELEKLRNSDGATGGGLSEWEVNYSIAKETEKLLKDSGAIVEVLPATIPKNYWADVFISIHADGSLDTSKSGFKVAAPWRDFTGNAENLRSKIENTYKSMTGLENDPNITRNMRGYYAFSWWRFDHAIHPMTTAVILETGFLTNYSDRQMLINNPQLPAKALSEAITNYLEDKELLDS